MTLSRKPAEKGSHSTLRRSRKPSKRSRDPVTEATFQLVIGRAGGRCEAPADLHPATGCRGRMHVHHRLPVSWGGGPEVTNLLLLCEPVHSWAHNHPAAAITHGLLVPRWKQRQTDPAVYPVWIRDGRRVLLGADGDYKEHP